MDIAHYLHPHPPRSATLTSLPLPLHRTALLSSSSSPSPSPSSSFPLSITSPASPSIAATPKPFPLPELDHPDFLAIDDLLDFCNDEIGGPSEPPISFSTTPSPSSTAPTTSPASTAPAPAPAPAPPPLQSFPEPPVSSEKKQQVLSVFDSDEICVPCDELAELEWLSNFVEESFSSVDTTHPPASTVPALEGPRVVTTSKVELGKAEQEEEEQEDEEEEEEEEEEKTSRGTFHSTSPVSVLEGSLNPRERATSFSPETSIPARARTKRCRAAVCFWNSRILSAEASESILETSSTTSTITTDNDMFAATYYDEDSDDDDDDEEEEEIIDRDHINENASINDDDDDDDDEHINKNHPLPSHPQSKRFEKNGSGKGKKSGMNNTASTNKSKRVKVLDGASVRKCLHCASQKTPQWRAGPLGPKTLCNACGVRYKSGRLCAEYRPASSPTFNETEHSNSHRRVLEMRRQRGEPVINSNNASVVSHRHEKLSNRDSYVEDQGRLYVAKH